MITPALLLLLVGAPVRFELGGGQQLELGLLGQLRSATEDRPPGAPAVKVGLQRLRETVRWSLLERRLVVAASLNTTPGNLELIEASVELRPNSELRGKLGLFKLPFTRYRSQSYAELAFVDWATTVTRSFGAEQQVGLLLGATPGALEAELGAFAGTPARASHGLGLAPSYRKSVANRANLEALDLPGPLHPELAGRLTGHLPALGLELTFSAALDLAPEPQLDLGLRLAPELRFLAGPFSLLGIYYLGGAGYLPTTLTGHLLEAAFEVEPGLRVAARWARLGRSDALLRTGDAPPEEQELALGLGFRIAGTGLQLSSDLAYLTQAPSPDLWRARAQLQLGW